MVSQNIARSAGVAGSEKARLASGSKPDASGEGKKQNFLQRVWSWIRGEGGGVNLTRNYRGGAGGGYQIGNISESSYGGVGGMVNTISNSAYGGDNNVAFNWGNPVDKILHLDTAQVSNTQIKATEDKLGLNDSIFIQWCRNIVFFIRSIQTIKYIIGRKMNQ